MNLLEHASDIDAIDVLNVSNLTLTGGDASGVTVNGDSLFVDTSAYQYLDPGDTAVITYSYDVIDGNGGSASQTASITIQGTNGLIIGTIYPDTLTGTEGADDIYGRGSQDTLYGRGGNDRLFGERGNDELYGEDGDDNIYGNSNDDILNGGTGADLIIGDAGNDVINGGTENDRLYGGT